MSFSVIDIWDATLPGDRKRAGTLQLNSANTTLRELIRARVCEDLRSFNESRTAGFVPLVQLEDSEILLNGDRKSNRLADEEIQVQRAYASFHKNGFLVFVNGRQICDLEEMIELRADPAGQLEVEFLKLIPLIGG